LTFLFLAFIIECFTWQGPSHMYTMLEKNDRTLTQYQMETHETLDAELHQ